jgi:hypothetical protein
MSIDGHAFIDLIKLANIDADALEITARNSVKIHKPTLTYEISRLQQDIKNLTQGVSMRKSISIRQKTYFPELSLSQSPRFSSVSPKASTLSTQDKFNSKFREMTDPCTPMNITLIRKSYDLPEIKREPIRHIGNKIYKKPRITRFNPSILPRVYREDPHNNPAPLNKKDLENGLLSLINKGVIPRDADVGPAFMRGLPPLQHRQMMSNQLRTELMKLELERSIESIHHSMDIGIGTDMIDESELVD